VTSVECAASLLGDTTTAAFQTGARVTRLRTGTGVARLRTNNSVPQLQTGTGTNPLRVATGTAQRQSHHFTLIEQSLR